MKNIEDILKETGGDGRFQLIFITFVTLPRLPMMWIMLEMSYANYVPEWCCLPDNQTSQSEESLAQSYCYHQNTNISMFSKSCTRNNSTCDQKFFTTGTDTIVNEWDLVCDKKWIVPMATSIQMAGVLVGAFLGGQLADWIGRKKTLFVSIFVCGVFNIVGGFSVSWEMFLSMRFFIGVAIGGFLVVPMPYMMEFLSPSIRAFPTLIPASQFGAALMALTAWKIPDWRWLHWIGGAIAIPTAIGYFFVPESLRWLTVQGRIEEAEDVVKHIARLNKKPVPKDCVDILKGIADRESQSASKRYTYIHLYKDWNLLKTSVILQFLWCVLSMGSYGMSFSAASLGFNLYLNIFIMNMVVIPFNLSLTCLVNNIGRKKSTMIFLIVSSVCGIGNLIAHLVISDKYTRDLTINILSMIFRGAQTTSWSAIGILSNEIYPTVIRGLGSGALNTAARIGGIVAPFALNLEDRPVVAFSLMAGLMAVSVILVTFLEETKGLAMKDSNLEDQEKTISAERDPREVSDFKSADDHIELTDKVKESHAIPISDDEVHKTPNQKHFGFENLVYDDEDEKNTQL
ncbi:solute carrier family 22 member 7-like [Biomphalaria glabrata]|uniref:Solute carrier family 22 member 7-like n=1 Tax=Biomphalaria glabrata TaxID=6526 RepID=A0A9W2ZUZ6_BIOGL|nr:solute carrier family 22 member 7-like [Biomphalaria glabrata]